jgi:hypothetical protein
MKSLGKRLPIFAALALGWIIGGFSASSPTALAQAARVTLDSLQTQINRIVDGTTTVGNAERLNGRPNEELFTAGPGLFKIGTTFGVAEGYVDDRARAVAFDSTAELTSALDSRYVRLPAGAPSVGQTIRWNGAAWVFAN